MDDWTCALELNEDRSVAAGSPQTLRDAIRRGADLRIYSEFRHNEHVDPRSDDDELVRETAEFCTTYLVDDRWAAGIMTLRQPVSVESGFGPRPSMSFFMYNEDGRQAIARPHLDGLPAEGEPGASAMVLLNPKMPKYHQLDSWDAETNAPSHNFIYDFDLFRYWVRDDWEEVLAHGADGTVISGSVDELVERFARGADVKVGIRGLCDDLAVEGTDPVDHELFVHTNSCYFHTRRNWFRGATQPLVRVRSAVPMEYASGGWDFGWVVTRSDGTAALRLVDPYTLRFRDEKRQLAVRWLAR